MTGTPLPVRARERGTPRAELCTSDEEFARLTAPWDRLYRRCGAATPFQSHAWLHSWWLSYGRRGGLRLVLVRGEGDELLAVAPLMLVRGPLPALVPLGGTVSDYADVLIDDGHTERATTALTEGLAAAARTALIDFREVRPGAAVERVYERWRGPRRRVADSVCLELPARPLEKLLERLPRARAQRVRAKIRKLADLGVEHRSVRRPEEVETALRTMLDLHRLQWQGRGVTGEHLRPRFLAHLVRSVVPMVCSGEALVTEFRLDGEVVAVDVTLLSRRVAGGYLYGAHPRLRERKADVATMLLHASAGQLGGGGHEVLSLLRGAEPYKYRWRPDTVVNQRILLARRRTAPLLSAVVCGTALLGLGKRLLRR
ncbi:GNAT family N-acetyltransferase [Streptomyces poonensis]|uniref:Glycosyl transferase family 1 n=1 Tax=Streptomyces poonensis TaxID=68255 RepID=A0A918UL64_9ACTN|nr:GNAT family N-acetyltransferase [Streptomyces poonensis]GGZ17798.1 glycosyl transferase family 1 [Streptomyces poonensis]GLJ91008.1 glycosyl transferase family 1 [Streptomyces poonensis]